MPVRRDTLRRFLRAFGLGLSLVLIGVMSQALAAPIVQGGPAHVEAQPVLLQAVGPRLVPAKAERVAKLPHSAVGLVPGPFVLAAAPRSGGSLLVPRPLLRTPLSVRFGWQARAPPDLTMQSTT